MNTFSKRSGFTIIELLVVLSVILILLTVVTPAVSKAKEKANKTICINNLRQISVALTMYANENDGKFPPDGAKKWSQYLSPDYIKDNKTFDCPTHAFVGSIAAADYGYQSGYDLESNPGALIVWDYEGCHGGLENKLTIGGKIIFQKSASSFP